MRAAVPWVSLLIGCAEAPLDTADMTDIPTDVDYSGDVDAGDADADADSDTDTLPPEQEKGPPILPPAQTDRHVFVANPDRHTVTRIGVQTLDVDTTPVGTDPRIVLATPDSSRAVVFNRGDDSVTVLDADTLDQQTVDVRPHLNAMAMSPNGRWVVLWHDSAAERADDPAPPGLQSFNEASFVDLRSVTHHPMAVGFDPRMVRFTPDGRTAVVVSDAYLARVDLRGERLAPRLFELAPGALGAPAAEEVILAADGSFAWVRQFGAAALLVVDLESGAVDPVPAGINPTDLDLSPDGRQAVAVARGSSELWIYDAGRPFAPARVVGIPGGGLYGSLLFAPTGERALLYTTASPTERFAVWDPADDALFERSLVKPVSSAAVTPDGGAALFFHTQTDGPETEPLFSGQWAITLVDLSDFHSNPLLLPAEPIGFANSTSGRRGYFVMDRTPFLEVLDYATLLHDQLPLFSPPLFVGVAPDLDPSDEREPMAWVSQEHPLGRLTFYDPADRSLETLTGFELNSGIDRDR